MKALIFDSGTIINLSMNGLLYILNDLKKSFDGKFITTRQVKYEIIDRPIKVPRFELEALRVKELMKEGVLEDPSTLGIDENIINKKTAELLKKANHLISSNGKWIEIVSDAEMSCLALSTILSQKGIKNIIAVDERTTRIMSEKPEALEDIISKKIHQRVKMSPSNIFGSSSFKFIRSSELVYVAYKKGILKLKGREALEAALYATKFKGAAISWDEIKEIKKLG